MTENSENYEWSLFKTLNIMHKFLQLMFSLLLCPIISFSQITQSEARPVDSTLATQYLDMGNFHTLNYHGLTFPPGGYFIWDAGCGLYKAIDDYFLAWSHTGMVADTLAACIDTMPHQAYRLFNLADMINTEAYRDSVELYLNSLGIPVGIRTAKDEMIKIWPNPFDNFVKVKLPENGWFTIRIVNSKGKTITNENAYARKGQVIDMDLSNCEIGMHVIVLNQNRKLYTQKIIKHK